MSDNGFRERRGFTRFPVHMQAAYANSASRDEIIPAETNDIGAIGLGLITGRELSCGIELNVCLRMRDNGEEIKLKGKVVWVSLTATGKYRVGVKLDQPHLKPIPLVLRFIQSNLLN